MDRRTFLSSTTALALGTVLSGCQSTQQSALRIRLLRGSVPALLTKEFRQQFGQGNSIHLDVRPEAQLQDLFDLLQRWKRQATGEIPTPKPIVPLPIPWIGTSPNQQAANLISLGDPWLAVAIRQKLIQPIVVDGWKNAAPEAWNAWNSLPSLFQDLVRRNDDGMNEGNRQIWAIPYRWGSLAIVYRKDLLAQKGITPPTDWADLWRSEFQGHLSLPDQPREVIGLVLKKLGQSCNPVDLQKIPNLRSELQGLQNNVKFYSSQHYLQALILGDTWIAVGSSSEMMTQLRRNPNLAAVFPASGTVLWADLWVQPALAQPAPANSNVDRLIAQWTTLGLQAKLAPQFTLISQGTSPSLLTLNPDDLPEALRRNPLLYPDRDRFSKSEFLQPLSPATAEQYRQMWESIRKDR
uniref:extracellular solute-binding protein n=1 Tax=Alkalinema sp. FACHB-956 TaxID=2692768 RepID=UPI0016873DF0|nr:extracellular solute-binding protein [Alkalinema sp. FACHB-956]MBD2328302.1 extracellular solute-binding protein [Alkalinema sp. FACHB-956]